MELRKTPSVEIALRTLPASQLRRIHAWFDNLRNWSNDPHVRKMSRKLPDQDAFVLTTTDGYSIFFRKEADAIDVIDIAKTETIALFAGAE